MSHSFHHQPEGGPTAQTVPPSQSTQNHSLPRELREHVHRLRLILPVISVSVMALHRENADLGADIASVLSRQACEPPDYEIAHLESILASRTWRRWQQEAHA